MHIFRYYMLGVGVVIIFVVLCITIWVLKSHMNTYQEGRDQPTEK